MASGEIVTSQRRLKGILETVSTIAVIGLSPNPEKDSHKVAAYLKSVGYKIIPVWPKESEILGETVYRTIEEIPEPVDLVNVFRRSHYIVPHAREAIAIGAGIFWMQLGIRNSEAADLLTHAGIDVVMNRCTKVDHESFFKKNILI